MRSLFYDRHYNIYLNVAQTNAGCVVYPNAIVLQLVECFVCCVVRNGAWLGWSFEKRLGHASGIYQLSTKMNSKQLIRLGGSRKQNKNGNATLRPQTKW